MMYVYGISTRLDSHCIGDSGLYGKKVLEIPFRDISAIVTNLQEKHEITLGEARSHERVLRALISKGTVLPMSFGFCLKDEIEVENLLMQGYTVFRNALERLKEKIQVDVKISWSKNIFSDVLIDNEELQALVERTRYTPSDQNLKIELGRKVKATLVDIEKKLLPGALKHLKFLAYGYRENKIKGDDMLLNASLLLDREREQELYHEVKVLERKHEGKLTFLIVGPLLPYNFVDIHIEKLDYRTLDEARRALGLTEMVTISEVSRAFNQLARSYHPDLDPSPEARDRFNSVRRARDVLLKYCEHHPCPIRQSNVESTIIVREDSH